MIKRQMLVAALAITIILTGALAQKSASKPAQSGSAPASKPAGLNMDQPRAESVLGHIPADCMGFVVAGNLKDLMTHIELFAGAIGMGEQLKAMAPDGILQTAAMQVGIGEGFNPNGGVAVVLLDMEKAGLDVVAMSKGQDPGGVPPVVILLAGKSAKDILPAMPLSEDGKTIMLPGMGPAHFAQLGQYVALSPSEKAIAMMTSESTIATAVSKAQQDLLKSSDVALYYNVKVLVPFMQKITDASKPEGDAEGTTKKFVMPGLPTAFLDMYIDLLEQFEGLTIGLNVAAAGITANSVVEYVPDSELGKMVASLDAGQGGYKALLNKLPNLPYALAGGQMFAKGQSKVMVDQTIMTLEALLGMAELQLPADLKQRMIALGQKSADQVEKMQFVVGGPKTAGLFGSAMVIQCKSAKETKALLPEKAELLTELIQKTIGEQEADAKTLEFKYIPGVATVAGLAVDAIEVTSEKIAKRTDEKKANMVKVLGEENIRFLIAEVDATTLVVSLGGGESFLAEVIAAAAKGGNIADDPGVAEAMKTMPAKVMAAMVISPANIFGLIQSGMKTMGEKSNLPEGFAFEGKVPVALAGTVEGNVASSRLFVPASAIKDIYGWIMAEMASASQPAAIEEDVEVEETAPAAKPAKKAPAKKKAE